MIFNRHAGKRICVMGGGPSLKADIEKVEADVWISCNQHGAALRPVDYVVALDDVHDVLHRPMREVIREHTDAPIIAPHDWADIRISKPSRITGTAAFSVAAQMGARQIILAGFDCYGGQKHVIEQFRAVDRWVVADVLVVSGPLLSLFPEAVPA